MKIINSKLQTPNSKLFNLIVLFSFLCLLALSGCATLPPQESFTAYSLNGTTYYSLVSLCEARGVSWQYDTFSRGVTLTKGNHRINLLTGDTLALVDGESVHLDHPLDLYQGMIVVPVKFKDQVFDSLFGVGRPERKTGLSISKIRKVVIDAGHGGNDPGAIGKSGLKERDVNLDIARRLAGLLKSSGIQVLMTRSNDTFIPLGRRVDIANNSGADLFISIHSNANRVRSLNGFEVYYVSPTVSDFKRAQASSHSSALRLDRASLADNSRELKTILWDMIYTNSRAESIELARSICRSTGDSLDVRVIGVKNARYEVLRGIEMPGVLVEVGFVSNPTEERKK